MSSWASRILIGSVLCFASFEPSLARQPVPVEQDLMRLFAMDARMATVGQRLAVGALDLCVDLDWRPGFVALDLAHVDPSLRAAANRVFGRESGLMVVALAEDGPAARAGLRSYDEILVLDGRARPEPAEAGPERSENMEAMLAFIDDAFADGRADVDVRRGTDRLTIPVDAERACASRIQGVRQTGRRARADGRNVDVSAALIDYAADDAELAAIVAHELAHNILRHRARLNEAGVSRGFLGIGRDTRRIRETEIEADRLSVYLMERAGYDPEAAIRFWTRFGPHPLNFLRVRDHPSWRERIRLMRIEIEAIRRTRAEGRTPMPDFLPRSG